MQALARKGCWHVRNGHWVLTDLGKEIHASRGVLRSGHRVWDSATHEEREALRRVVRHGWANYSETDQDRRLAESLKSRMASAGELQP